MKELLDNKKFLNINRALFSNKSTNSRKITLIENEEIIADDKEIAETFCTFFKEAVDKLDIIENTQHLNLEARNIEDPIDAAIALYENHPSILKIREVVSPDCDEFKFRNVTLEEVNDQFRKLNPAKATTFKNIPPKVLKSSRNVVGPIVHNLMNKSLATNKFPDRLKNADVNPGYKPGKKDPTNKDHYRPVSKLPPLSKIFERLMQTQIADFIDKHLSLYLCGYRTGFSKQHALIALIEK